MDMDSKRYIVEVIKPGPGYLPCDEEHLCETPRGVGLLIEDLTGLPSEEVTADFLEAGCTYEHRTDEDVEILARVADRVPA